MATDPVLKDLWLRGFLPMTYVDALWEHPDAQGRSACNIPMVDQTSRTVKAGVA